MFFEIVRFHWGWFLLKPIFDVFSWDEYTIIWVFPKIGVPRNGWFFNGKPF